MTMFISSAPSAVDLSMTYGHGVNGSPLAISVAGLNVHQKIHIVANFSDNSAGINAYLHFTDTTNQNLGVIAASSKTLVIDVVYDGTNVLVSCSGGNSTTIIDVAPTGGKTVDTIWIYSVAGGATCDFSAEILKY